MTPEEFRVFGYQLIDWLADMRTRVARGEVWLHVDAALGGSAMILPEQRHLWEGVEDADSLVVNPHKWMGVAFDCSTYYVRDPEHLIRVMSSNPSYLQTAHDGEARNYRDWGVPSLPRDQAMVRAARARRGRAAGAVAPRSRGRAVVGRARARGARVEPPGAGAAADAVRAARAARADRRGARRTRWRGSIASTRRARRTSSRPSSKTAEWCASRPARCPPSART